jgi:hypothetical protein
VPVEGDAPEAGAPDDDDFEITPRMMAAGRLALAMFNDDFESFDAGVERIWFAMVEARSVELDLEAVP